MAVMVPNFTPSLSGFNFANSFSSVPLLTISVGPVQVPIGDASNGLCGGMVFAVRDYYDSGLPIPPDTTPPSSGPLFDYLVRRLFDSFNIPGGPLTYMYLMDPALPDHETWASNLGIAPRGRAWHMINIYWPRIRAHIDNGNLCPLALVTIKARDPFQLGQNHQVLAYGYQLVGDDLEIFVYDPNYPDNDTVRLSLNISDPQHTTQVDYSGSLGGDNRIWCFFCPDYALSRPPSAAPGMIVAIRLRANNGQYLCAEGGGGRTLFANRNEAREWETFYLIDGNGPPLRSGDQVTLRANNQQFVCAEGGGGQAVTANRDLAREWETFTIIRADATTGDIASGDQISLRASNGQFVCAEDGGGREIVANRNTVGPWETFTLEILPS